jgi:hypothetical protein
MRKTILLTFQANGTAREKMTTVGQIAKRNFVEYFTPSKIAMVLYSNGKYELFDSTKEARQTIAANENPVEFYIRGDRKIPGAAVVEIENWMKDIASAYTTTSSNTNPVAPVSGQTKVENTTGREIISNITANKKPIVEPVIVTGEEKDTIIELMKILTGGKSVDGTKIQITKVNPDVKPVVHYEQNDGTIQGLTITELRLLSLLYRTTEELQKNANLKGITLSVEHKFVGPSSAKAPFLIEEIEAVINTLVKTV